jgi:hypothetical protein
MVTRDLLTYDSTAWEKVFSKDGKLEELNPTRGDDWWPIIDTNGRVISLEQRIDGIATAYSPKDVVYLNLFPNTTTPRGLPLIETIITEVISIMRGAERSMSTLDASEIPPGVLFMTGVAGKAAEDVINSFVKDKGKDHKMRVLNFPQKGSGDIQWIRLDNTPKELEMKDIVEQIRRTIWRIFGVFPVEMGATDGMPRATAEVQMDASTSHLIVPILELLQDTITTQVLPHLIDPKWVGLLEFSFDFTRDLSPAETKQQAETDVLLVEGGILTRNEVRLIRGLAPVDGGDMITVAKPATPLGQALSVGSGAAPKPEPAPKKEDPPDDDGTPGATETAPGEVEKKRQSTTHRHSDQCAHRALGSTDDIPKGWGSEKLQGKRTLALRDLGLLVSQYQRTVEPLFDQARDGVLTAVAGAYRDNQFTAQEAAKVANTLASALTSLAMSWESETSSIYLDAANLGDSAAREHAGSSSAISAKDRSNAYATQAMGWLSGPDGPLENVRLRVAAILGAVSRSAAFYQRFSARAQGFEAPAVIEPGVSLDILLEEVARCFNSNRHRIANWAGKLIELATQAANSGMLESGQSADTGEPTDWMVEWADVGDDNECSTCTNLGGQGFMTLRSLPTVPGGATECGALCRCVLVYWMEEEVKGGKAELLGGTNTGEPL